MSFVLLNAGDGPAQVSIEFFNPGGFRQALPFETGDSFDRRDFELIPHASVTLRTTGASDPLRTGYAILRADRQGVSGVAVFHFESGAETSVLPVSATRVCSLPGERNAHVDTGFAVFRPGDASITLRAYDPAGNLWETCSLSMEGRQTANFLSEAFTKLPTPFHGTITVESSEPFALVGLRFGAYALSTVPVVTGVDDAQVPGGVGSAEARFSPRGGIRDRLIDEIDRAASTIDVAIYSFTSDELGRALIRARNRGVRVRIVTDRQQAGGLGSEIPYLESLGFQVRRCQGEGLYGSMHHKFMVVDGNALVTGSYNWSAAAEQNNYENALFLSTAPVIDDYRAEFSRLLQCP